MCLESANPDFCSNSVEPATACWGLEDVQKVKDFGRLRVHKCYNETASVKAC